MRRKKEYTAAQLRTLPVAVASGLYIGFLPMAPGTWGSIAALPLFFVARQLPLTGYLALVAALCAAGIFFAGGAAKVLDRRDPAEVVIDEIAGILIALAGAPPSFAAVAAGFLFFRLFDIVKPFPVRQAEALNGGWGIMADDIVAGLYAWLCLFLTTKIMGWL